MDRKIDNTPSDRHTSEDPSRREALRMVAGTLGALGVNALWPAAARDAWSTTIAAPSAAHSPHFPAKAKAVIWLFMNGGPSHIDTWDYKPELARADGKELGDFDATTGFFSEKVGPLLKSPFAFQQHGECGQWVSSLFPHLARYVDQLAFVKSFHTPTNNHSPALFMANCGVPRMGRPCAGSWVSHALGSENESLPAFVVMTDPMGRGMPKGGAANWSSGFLPGSHQGTWLRNRGAPIENLERAKALDDAQQRHQLDFIARLNGNFEQRHPHVSELPARSHSFELAYRMQSEAPKVFDLQGEPSHTHTLYGTDDPACSHFAKQCLLARRMVEHGVRFVQIYSGGTQNARSWDGHGNIQRNHTQFAAETDKPIAGLLADLAQRGLLDETLVIWGGEFGRLPVSQVAHGKPTGRDHNPHAGCFWFAGGGVKGGTSYGETDELGHKVAENPVDIHDIHATMLHLLGLDHERLTYMHDGREFRLTDVAGRVLHPLLA